MEMTMRSPLRSLAVLLLLVTLVFGLPRYAQGTDGTGGGAGDYGTSTTTAPDPTEQAPPEITPDHDPSLPAPDPSQQNGDPTQDPTLVSPDPD